MFERKSRRHDSGTGSTVGVEAAPAQENKSGQAAATATTRGPDAMIGAKVKVNGDIVSSEDLLINGEVTGTITLTDNELVVGTSGRVQANISAKTVRIEGEVNGDIESSERVVICASGNVRGNINSPRVMLEDGGRFKGSIDMGGSKPLAAAKTAPAAALAPEVRSIDKAG